MSPIGGHSHAAAINNRSEVVGWYETSPGITHAWHYRYGVLTDLGTWGGRSAQATAINANGDIAGFREVRVNGVLVKQGVRLRKGGIPRIVRPLAGFDNLVPTEINGLGDLAGSMSLNGSDFPYGAAMFIARGLMVTRLNSASCCYPFVGFSLNTARQVVGYRFDQNGDPPSDAWLWDADTGAETDLSRLPEVQAAGWLQMGEAGDINNKGMIVGFGKWSSNRRISFRAFMLEPIASWRRL